jgi:hypothetical protein
MSPTAGELETGVTLIMQETGGGSEAPGATGRKAPRGRRKGERGRAGKRNG